MPEHNVVDLVDAEVPADQGLSSLGLLMQLAGNVLAAYAALILFFVLLASRGDDTLALFLVLGLSIARSLMHRSAGAQLLYGPRMAGLGEGDAGGGRRLAGVRRYIMFALIQSAAVAAIVVLAFHVGVTIALAVAGGLAGWPVALAVIFALPRFKKFRDAVPMPEDKGFEGTSILMTVLGLCGIVAAGTMLLVMLDMPGRELQRGAGVLVVLSVIMLLVRSLLHAHAGISGLRETSVDHSVERANRYANFGVISSFCMGGAMLLWAMSSGVELTALAMVCGLVWMLMAWPLIVRRFYNDRQFSELLAGDHAPLHRRSPDAGLTGLGWLLVAYAALAGSFLLPELAMRSERASRELQSLFALGAAIGARSVWWSIGTVVLQAWAGFELVRMSPQRRAIATAYGVIGAIVTVYTNWPMLRALRHASIGGTDTMVVAPLAFALILPIATIVLVNRKIAPTARARYRT